MDRYGEIKRGCQIFYKRVVYSNIEQETQEQEVNFGTTIKVYWHTYAWINLQINISNSGYRAMLVM